MEKEEKMYNVLMVDIDGDNIKTISRGIDIKEAMNKLNYLCKKCDLKIKGIWELDEKKIPTDEELMNK